jgi:hypothetical protein
MRAQTEPVDIRVIRQSMRCFWCGALGMIPGVGLGLAGFALRQFRTVVVASGEAKPHLAFPFAMFAVALVSNPILQTGIGWPASILLTCALAGAAWISWARQFAQSSGQQWNPARAWAWGGAALAWTGIFLSIALLETFYSTLFTRDLLGTR